jgi:hypothetical protein
MNRYIYKMNKNLFLFISILLLVFSSCENEDQILKEVPLDFLAPENAYTTIPGIQQGIAGLHKYNRDNWWYEAVLNASGNLNSTNGDAVWWGLGTDWAYYGENPAGGVLADYTVNLTSTYASVSTCWQLNYSMIQKVNVLIEAINVSDPKIWSSEEKKNAYLAEAMFFRAFSYRMLVSYFGDVPLVKEVIKAPKTDFVRAPKEEIYKLIEDDFTFAAANLPKRGKEENPGRITQGAAWHYLSEAYLSEGKYQLAVDAATHVINDYGYALMTIRFGTRLSKDIWGGGDPYYDLFGYGNQNLATNTEAIWVIQVEPNLLGGGLNSGERAYGPAYFRWGKTPDGKTAIRGDLVNGVYTGYTDSLGRGVSWLRPTSYVAYTVWNKDGQWNIDKRNAKWNIKRNFYFDSPGSAWDKKKISTKLYLPGTRNVMLDTCSYIYPWFTKLGDPLNHFMYAPQAGNGYNHKDIYALRLAETLLLRAEAYVRLNNLPAAAADMNLIRARAQATPVSSQNVTLDYILDEYTRELYGESMRTITLRRMDKLVERVKLYQDNPMLPGGNIKDHHKLWPIPQTVIDLNLDAIMEQNPGY